MSEERQIEITGIVRSVKPEISKDGQCDEVINLRKKGGSWRPVGTLESVKGWESVGDMGYRKLYVHTNGYRHLLGMDGGVLWWIGDIEDGVVRPFAARREMIKVRDEDGLHYTQTGNLLVVNDGGLRYMLYRPLEDKYDESVVDYNTETDYGLLPYGNIDFKVERVEDAKGRPVWFSSRNISSGIIAARSGAGNHWNEELRTMRDVIEKTKRDVSKLNLFTGAFVVVTAAQLYDGNYILMSEPKLMMPPSCDSYDYFDREIDLSGVGETKTGYNSQAFFKHKPESGYADGVYAGYRFGRNQVGAANGLMLNDIRSGIFGGAEIIYGLSGNDKYLGASDWTYDVLGKGPGNNIDFDIKDYVYNKELVTDDDEFKAESHNTLTVIGIDDPRGLEIRDNCAWVENLRPYSGLHAIANYHNDDTVCFMTANKLRYRVNSAVMEQYKDVIKNISVFVSKSVDVISYIDASYQCIRNKRGALIAEEYYYNLRRDEDVINDLVSQANFYKIGEIKIEDTSTNRGRWLDLDIEKWAVENLITQERLETDSTGRDSFDARVAFPYNARLHIADYEQRMFDGWLLQHFEQYGGKGQYEVASTSIDCKKGECIGWIKTDFASTDRQGTVVRKIYKNRNLVGAKNEIEADLGRGLIFGKVERETSLRNGARPDMEIKALNPMLSYPNRSATKMTICIYYPDKRDEQLNCYKEEFNLKGSDYMPIAWYVSPDMRPISTAPNCHIDELNVPREVNNSVMHHNRMKASLANNPLYFPNSMVYSVGNGNIVGFGANSFLAAAGQVGDVPLYVFCSDGIYAFAVDSSGEMAYLNARLISQYICNNGMSITPTAFGVVFSTDFGLMALGDGNRSQDLTDKIEGEPYDVSEISEVGLCMNHKQLVRLGGRETNEDFLDYIKGAVIGYNYGEKEMWVVRKDCGYSYVLDREGEWSKRTDIGDEFVNDFPKTYMLNVENGVSTLRDLTHELKDGGRDTMFLTRPIKYDSYKFKQSERVVLRGDFRVSSSPNDLSSELDLRYIKREIGYDGLIARNPECCVLREDEREISTVRGVYEYKPLMCIFELECFYDFDDIDLSGDGFGAAALPLFYNGSVIDPAVGKRRMKEVDGEPYVSVYYDGGWKYRLTFAGEIAYKMKVGGKDVWMHVGEEKEMTIEELVEMVETMEVPNDVCLRVKDSDGNVTCRRMYAFMYSENTMMPTTQDSVALNGSGNYRIDYIGFKRPMNQTYDKVYTRYEVYVGDVSRLTSAMCWNFLQDEVINNRSGEVKNELLCDNVAEGDWIRIDYNGQNIVVQPGAGRNRYNEIVADLRAGLITPGEDVVSYALQNGMCYKLIDKSGAVRRLIKYSGDGVRKTFDDLIGGDYEDVRLWDKRDIVKLTNGSYYYIEFKNVIDVANGVYTVKFVGEDGRYSIEWISEHILDDTEFLQMNNDAGLEQAVNIGLVGNSDVHVIVSDDEEYTVSIEQSEVISVEELLRRLRSGEMKLLSDEKQPYAGVYLFGSYDNHKWSLIGAREDCGSFEDLGLMAHRVDCKFFRVLFVGKLLLGSHIDGISCQTGGGLYGGKIR